MKKENILIGAFLIAKIWLQFLLVNPAYDLQRDEYLHLDQAFHPAWGYLSVPPVTSWIARLIFLLGGGEIWVRFFPALAGVMTMYVLFKTVRILGGGLFAITLTGMGALFSTMLRLNMLFQPNAIDVLAWTTVFYFLVSYFKTSQHQYLYLLAVTFGLGFLNKYNLVFALAGLVPALLLTENRKIFANKHLYFSALVALVLISPNLIWQYVNGFPVIHHMADLSRTQLANNDIFSFLRSQTLFFLGALPVILAALFSLITCRDFQSFRYMFWSTIFTLMIFIFFKAKDYYAFGLYPILLAFGSVYLEMILSDKVWQKLIKVCLLILPPLSLYPVKDILFPTRSPQYILENAAKFEKLGLLRWEDGKNHALPQDFADMLGWKELAVLVDSVYAGLEDKSHTIILADNYGQAGAVNYYSVHPDLECHSFNADYANWIKPKLTYKHAILIKEEGDEDPQRIQEHALFDTVYLAGVRISPLARESKISVYVLKNAKADINRRIVEEANEAINRFKK